MADIRKFPIPPATKWELGESGEEDALIPAGFYELAYLRHDYLDIFGRTSLVVTFRLVSMYQGTTLCCYYRVSEQNKNYRAGPKSKLIRSARNLFGRSAASHGMPWDRLKNAIVEGEVVTVTTDSAGRDLGEANHYSIIERLVGIVQ